MSDLKIGDKVRKVGSSFLREFDIGNILTVTGFTHLGNPLVSGEEITAVAYPSDIELINDGPAKTYTLTPYIKPKTVTIDGIEYIMTENV